MLLLKRAVYNLLCNNVTGTLLLKLFPRIPDLRWKGYKFFVNAQRSSKTVISSIFFGFYESSEIRLIHRFYDGQSNVVELGGSMGVVSSHIASLMKNGKQLVVVEPNPHLGAVIDKNIRQFKQDNFKIVQAAIAYGAPEVSIALSMDSTASSLSTTKAANAVKVPAATLSGIIKSHNFERYTLVCDIEGGEAGMLFHDKDALDKCDQLFIELHDTVMNGTNIPIREMVEQIKLIGFQLVYNEGPVYYFKRTASANAA